MLNNSQRFTVNDKEVAAKLVEGEAILIHLTTGLYYSMGTVGARLWTLLEHQHSLEEMADLLASQYGIASDQALKDTERLVAELITEGLVSMDEDGVSSADGVVFEHDGSGYEPPVLNKFSDMADMFALDPPLPALAESDNKTGI